jgi:putative transposase
MARLARVVIPGVAHHVTQRGNRRERVFFSDDDYRLYLRLISAAAKATGTEIWAYCLMPNHVHFILVPDQEDGLRATFAQAHRRYTGHIHARERWTGHLWQGRFSSTAMDEAHLHAAIRYVDLNPVRAGLAALAADWPWSSARAHLAGKDDGVVTAAPVLARIDDFASYLDEAEDSARVAALRRSRSTGRPVGARDWIADLEARAGRPLAPGKRGRKPGQVPDVRQADLLSAVTVMLRFRTELAKAVVSISYLVYRPEEFSFDVTPAPLSGFTSILLDDLNLEVDETGKVISIWGLCPHTRWNDAPLAPPEAVCGQLFVLTDTPLERAISIRLTPERKYLPTFVDRSRGWVKVQGAANPKSAVMIIPGVIFEIGNRGEFCSLWLHPKSGIGGPETEPLKAR